MRRGLVVLACAVLVSSGRLHADVCDAIPIWRDGRPVGAVCRAEAAAYGLTVIDLRDDWVPAVLAAAPDDTGPPYRATYLALAQERFDEAGTDGELAKEDRYLELFGIVPTLTVVRERLADEARHRCHDAVDDARLARISEPIGRETTARATERIAQAQRLRDELDRERARGKLAPPYQPAESDAFRRYRIAWLITAETSAAAVRAAQAHLACDELLTYRPIDGAYTWQTSRAVKAFQRGVMILPDGVLDAPTREALVLDSRERDFRTALRVLRARVIAATGLIEDGTASTGQELVLGRALEPERTWRARGHEPLENGAPDLVSAATEVAARALGWHDAASTHAFLSQHAPGEIAIALPPLPSYHGASMDLSVEIDRGDVWYDHTPRRRDTPRRPALIVYARDDERRIPLARWPTTIGGWQNEKRADGAIVKARQESPTGRRVWRDLYVGPTWLPPETTPDRELVRRVGRRYVLARDALGPSYRAAFGIVAFPHLAEVRKRGQVAREYRGVRTHGTGDAVSIANGVSHGCHRLLGAHAIRLGSFVLRHREHVRRGEEATHYRRVVRHRGRFPVTVVTRGYRIELVRPITVDVLPGRIHPMRARS